MKKFLVIIAFLMLHFGTQAQQHKMSDDYVVPKDSLVRENIKEWQDVKFGLFMHWGPYSQWGVVESWSICPEDEDWTQRKGPFSDDYFKYKKAYENLQTTFNPVAFNPEKWVKAAKDAGMRYVVFTTKHHDGFSMFDTKQTDYKITDAKTPFSSNPRSNITKEVFNAFRKENFKIGAYFSKPDWHSEYYWWPYFPPKDRNVNYDPAKYPERWQKFKDFTYNQIEELASDYGKIDILWLDGGQVRPNKKLNQDIDMAKIAGMARSHQPGLIVVDRTVTGEFENYTTPEQQVPDKPLPYPWETCMTMGNSWSYVPHDTYKSAKQLVDLLVKIVSRGGNFLLNIGPGPNGDWDPVAYERLQDIGSWIKINGECIYGSKPIAPYSTKNIFYTQSKKGTESYAVWLAETEDVHLPEQIFIALDGAKKIQKVSMLGTKMNIKWKAKDDGILLTIPAALQQGKFKYAVAFKVVHK